MIYCMADIHGDFEKYKKMLSLISLSEKDTLYVVGDVVDRGANGMKILLDMMMRPNVIPLLGNHEYMAMHCLLSLTKEITEESICKLSDEFITGLSQWLAVGGQTTVDEFYGLSADERQMVLEYLTEFSLYDELEVNGKRFVLVHAGIDNFSENKSLESYRPFELIFNRADYSKRYYKDKYLVTGHTPTRFITSACSDEAKPACADKIYISNNHIAIDCGCGHGGRLGAIRLDDLKEFYV